MKIADYELNENHSSERSGFGPSRDAAYALPALRAFYKAGELNDLKERITNQLMAQYGSFMPPSLVRQAVREADSLAAITPFPALFLPSLAEEKVRLAQRWSIRQKAIRERSVAFAA